MACRLFGAKPLSKPMLDYCELDTKEQTQSKYIFFLKIRNTNISSFIAECQIFRDNDNL